MSAIPAPADAGESERRQIRGSSLLLLGRGISLPLTLAAQVLLARYLAKSDFGALAYALAVVTFFDGLAGLGLETALSRYISMYHEKRDWGRFFGIMVLTVAVIAAMGTLIVVLLRAFPELSSHLVRDALTSANVLIVIAFLIPLEALDQAIVALFASLASPRYILLRRNVIAPVSKLVVVVLAILFARDVQFVAWGYVISSALGITILAAMFFRHLRRTGLWQHRHESRLQVPVREALGFSIPLMATDMASTLIPLTSTMVLGFYHGTIAVAGYRVVLPLVGMIHVIMRSFNLLYTPHAARLFARDDPRGVGQLYWHSASWLAVGTLPLFAVIFLLAEPLTVQLYGERYAGSAMVLQILAVAFYFHVAMGMNGLTLRVLGKVRAVVATTIAAQVIGTVTALALIPTQGIRGAAIATAIAMTLDTALKQLLLLRADPAFRLQRSSRVYVAVAGAVALVVAAGWGLRPGIVVGLLLAAAISLLLLATLRSQLRVFDSFPELRRLFGRAGDGLAGLGERLGSAGSAVAATIAGPFLVWNDATLLAGILLLFLNAPVLLGALTGSAVVAGVGVLGLIGLAAFGRAVARRDGVAVDLPFGVLFLFAAVALLSTVFARDPGVAFSWLQTFALEVVVVYFLVLNAVRSVRTLRRVLRGLALATAVLCVLASYQEVTGNYWQQFMGLAQRDLSLAEDDPDPARGALRPGDKVRLSQRASGPIGEPNRWGQALLIVLPLSFLAFRHESARRWRFVLGGACTLVAGGVFLTYSRGALVTLFGMTLLLLWMRVVRWRQVAIGGLALLVVAVLVAPGTFTRLESIVAAQSMFGGGGGEKEADNAARGRMTEMLAAALVARDHPVIGVGPGHYTPYYSLEYMATPEIAFRNINQTRRAHSLYLEMAAETGILGLLAFLAVPLLLAMRLWNQRQRLKEGRADLAGLATGALLALAGYFGTAVFLHLSYQRYYGLLLGLCASCVAVIDAEARARAAAEANRTPLAPQPLAPVPPGDRERLGVAAYGRLARF